MSKNTKPVHNTKPVCSEIDIDIYRWATRWLTSHIDRHELKKELQRLKHKHPNIQLKRILIQNSWYKKSMDEVLKSVGER